ncbi:MAG: hypothetical protein LKJ29_03295 [Lactobacillus sp.]|jgi:hypothetical protein|uniref:Uncharacterized protein n=1 Tax=Lacticaseibacillus suilingensis TaxID=2799577 RepID=A0ABW4BHW4_9LACO|nr:hypothetical protein [Lacticaseibacillus suilingensis]MCI1893433.1 hypothetical protein [Lactobacillus sp.]MCI1917035.1 hypothetical protein [Lactobacillus sp.]MCI1941060.1 hypothetical protein [Lactobacillus sp.]MCI1971467.1 hypothetical protein [Lactobacillus sp.]MCI2017459.1 hypothetical protein [Lactobacillus sp.]
MFEDYASVMIYGADALGLLALLIYGFVRHDLLKSRPTAEAKATLTARWVQRLKVMTALSGQEPQYLPSLSRWLRVLGLTGLFAAAGCGAFIAEASGWNGTYYSWYIWLIALALGIWATIAWRNFERRQLMATANLKHRRAEDYQALGLHADGRYVAQLMGTAKYLIAAQGFFMLSCLFALLWN